MDVILKPKLGHDCYSDGHPVEEDGQDMEPGEMEHMKHSLMFMFYMTANKQKYII